MKYVLEYDRNGYKQSVPIEFDGTKEELHERLNSFLNDSAAKAIYQNPVLFTVNEWYNSKDWLKKIQWI